MVCMCAVRLRGKTDKDAAKTNPPQGYCLALLPFFQYSHINNRIFLLSSLCLADGLRRGGAARSSGTDAFLT